jgi:hypothetical protein
MLNAHDSTNRNNNQLSFATFKKGVLCALNGITILDEYRIPQQYGGGIVCRDTAEMMSYRSPDSYYYVFRGTFSEMRSQIVEHLWLAYNHKPSRAKQVKGRLCQHCARPFYSVKFSKYCSHSCYMATWQAANYQAKRAAKAKANV